MTEQMMADEGYSIGPMLRTPDLHQIAHEATVRAMVEWFFSNFEDPVENTPRDEGDWVWIWGGPYDAREELENTFGEMTTEHAISDAVSEIEEKGCEWAPSHSRMVRET
jgi:hypothetical protein